MRTTNWSKALLVLVAVALGGSAGQSQLYDFASAYPAIRSGVCALMRKPHNCPLPRNAIVPLVLSAELPRKLPSTNTLYVVSTFDGSLQIRVALEKHLPGRERPLAVYWAGKKDDLERIKAWAHSLHLPKTEDGRRYKALDLKLVEVPPNDQWGTVGTLQIVVLNSTVTLGAYLPASHDTLWFRLTGDFFRGWEPFIARGVRELIEAGNATEVEVP